jgi:geranylgeranyl diphosphate synthase type II
MVVASEEDIKTLLRRSAEEVNEALGERIERYGTRRPAGGAGRESIGGAGRLAEAMRYSLEAGGKRVRPVLVLWCCELCGGGRQEAMPAAVAVECVHTFSLIHDDLPALDDDDQRRGRASSHRRFGEALAILAGDGLLALAFEILAREIDDPAMAVAMVGELAEASGAAGMIGGEAADIEGESTPPDATLASSIHAAKTARLIEASCRLGAMAAGADDKRVSILAGYGQALGMAYQAVDDLLDATVSSAAVGKGTGKDEAAGKQTYPRAVGIEETRKLVAARVERAIARLAPIGPPAWKLVSLSRFVADRQS